MSCAQCEGIKKQFSDKTAKRDLKRYHKKGPRRTTSRLINALKELPLQGLSLLDIGGGVGMIQFELIKAGVSSAIDVDASPAYLAAASQEAKYQGVEEKITYHSGNFTDVADEVAQADIVTLDKVVCCYDDMHELMDKSLLKSTRYYAMVYPRDGMIARLISGFAGLMMKLKKSSFRSYIHPVSQIEGKIEAAGFRRIYSGETFPWLVGIWER